MPHGASGKNNPPKSKVFGTNWLGKKRGESPVLVTGYSLLVTRARPSPRLRVAGHPPSCKARHPPPGIHPRDTSRGARGRWALARSRHGDMLPTIWAVGNRPPRPNHPRKLHFRGARYRAPLRRGELYSATVRPKFPSVGGVGEARGGKRVRK